MKVVVQRSQYGECTVEGDITGSIDHGIVALVGFTHDDTEKDLQWMAEKLVHLRIFEDETGKMNKSLIDTGGQILSISQFTLYGDCKKGRRPNFMEAAKPEQAEELYNRFNAILQDKGVRVETGTFGAMMNIRFTNEGPVTLILESPS
ncbi:D-tyrosyl-tRNA(Tyr) deacylase [Alteribacillus persepolensis]|uniref:D-aminoacyl-tRNA deacylase n=1 Tax=Alteribacillus persepolensis TaxID=568899 RepID=A0A1G8DJA4_9BACI|nr:D-aminoacyl-tRNA deacylase [Alteribacillus persepolensis]SDH57490.1 D-tyrosyl-tRNA(Tyr) deacylase [Alteribacillus persepolensis]